MTRHRTLNIAAAVLLAAVIGSALSTSHLLDGSDPSAEWQRPDTLADAQRAARAARQAELDAIRQCTHLHGPGAAVGYDVDGNVVCGKQRALGNVTVASSKGGAL